MKFSSFIKTTARLTLFFFIVTGAFSQTANKADTYLREGDIVAAKNEIDLTIGKEEEKLNKKGKAIVLKANTLYLKAIVYEAIAVSKDPATAALAPDALKMVLSAYDMLVKNYPKSAQAKLVAEGGVDPANITGGIKPPAIDNLYAQFINLSADAYNNGALEDAMASIAKARYIKPEDTLSYVYGVQFSYELKRKVDSELASTYEDEMPEKYATLKKQSEMLKNDVIQQANKLLGMGCKREYLYTWLLAFELEKADKQFNTLQEELIQVKEEVTKETTGLSGADRKQEVKRLREKVTRKEEAIREKATEIYASTLQRIQRFRADFPNSSHMMTTEVNIYLKTGKAKAAIKSINNSLTNDPENAELLFALGVMHDQLNGEAQKADNEEKRDEHMKKSIAAYTKATQVDPTNYNAYLNLGALYYNAANILKKELNGLETIKGYSDTAKAEKLIANIKELYQKAVPIFEKAIENKPSDEAQNLQAFLDQIQYFMKKH